MTDENELQNVDGNEAALKAESELKADELEALQQVAKDDTISRERFNQVWAEKKELQERIRRYEEERNRPAPDSKEPTLDDLRDKESQLEEKIEAAFLSGNDEDRKAARQELRSVRREIDRMNAEQVSRKASETAEARVMQSTLEKTAQRVAKEYPFLDSTSPEANPEAIDEVIGWRDVYVSRGEYPHVALEKAVAKIAPQYEKQDTANPRNVTAIRRNVDTANRQPPGSAGVGNRAQEKADVKDIPQDDWQKLSPAERDRLLRG